MATTEAKVINSLCQNKDISVLMSGEKVDELFVGHPDVWQFIKKYYSQYRAIPDASVLEEKFMYFDAFPVQGETMYHLDQLREEYMNNRLEQLTTRLKQNVGAISSKEVIAKSLNSLMNLSQMSFGSKDLDITDWESAEEDYKEVRRQALENGGTPGIPTGIDFIDASYPAGLAGGDLIVVLGWTGRAKSLFTTLVCCNAFTYGYKPMIVSLEMNVEKVRDRAYTILGNGLFKNSDLTLGDINEDDFRSWSKKQGRGNGFTVVAHDGNNEVTPAVVQSKIDQHKPDIIVLDYAQLMSDNANSGDMTARMRNMSREYKALAQANNIPVILISSATPDSAASTNTPPIIEQVAWSKQLSYDADLAIAPHKHDSVPNEDFVVIEVACRKNRNGDLFTGYLKADINAGKYKTFFSLEDLAKSSL